LFQSLVPKYMFQEEVKHINKQIEEVDDKNDNNRSMIRTL